MNGEKYMSTQINFNQVAVFRLQPQKTQYTIQEV